MELGEGETEIQLERQEALGEINLVFVARKPMSLENWVEEFQKIVFDVFEALKIANESSKQEFEKGMKLIGNWERAAALPMVHRFFAALSFPLKSIFKCFIREIATVCLFIFSVAESTNETVYSVTILYFQ